MRGLIATSLVLVLVGCSIGALDGFSGGDDGRSDASPDATANEEAGLVDAAANDVDTGPNEAGGEGGDAGLPFSCDAGTYVFCTSFDDGVPTTGWLGSKTQGGGTLGTSNDARSAPFAFRSQIPAFDVEDQYARLYYGFSGIQPVRVSFDVKIAGFTSTLSDKAFGFFEIFFPTTKNSTYLFREPDKSTLSMDQNGEYAIVPTLPIGTWVRIALEVVLTTPTGAIRLFYDGQKVFEKTDVAFQTPTAPTTEIFLGLVRFDPPAGPVDVLYDNVTIERIP